MALRNANPGGLSIFGLAIGTVFVIVGGWLIYADWKTFLQFVKLFAGFFLLLFGLGILGTSVRRF